MIVHDPNAPFEYDDEFTLTLSDWNHQQMPDLLSGPVVGKGKEPFPDASLINDSTNTKIKVLPNKTYLVHIICTGNWPGHFWVIDGHEMTVVGVDGVYTDPHPAGDKFLRVATGQRMSVLIKTKADTSKNFAIWDTMDVNMMFVYENRTMPENFNPNATAWLVYDEAKPLPEPPVFHKIDPNSDFVDDVALIPADHEPLLEPVDRQIILDTGGALVDGVPRFTVNNQTYIGPKVPTLYTANTVGAEFSSNPEVYGQVNPFILKHNEIVEIVINNHHNNLHPWHLHGHKFQVLQRSAVDGGFYSGLWNNISATPIKRDTIMVQNNGHTVIRFRADNPGVWMLHCHVEWHVEAGLMATIIEAPETFPNTVHAPPKSHYDACAAYPQPVSGNAAGNAGLDLTGLNTTATLGGHGALYTKTKKTESPAVAHPDQQPSPAPVSKPSAPQPQPEAPKPDSPHSYYEQPPAAPNHNGASANGGGNWPAPHTGETTVSIDSPNEPHDHHLTIHEESTKGPWANQNTHGGYVIDGNNKYPITGSE